MENFHYFYGISSFLKSDNPVIRLKKSVLVFSPEKIEQTINPETPYYLSSIVHKTLHSFETNEHLSTTTLLNAENTLVAKVWSNKLNKDFNANYSFNPLKFVIKEKCRDIFTDFGNEDEGCPLYKVQNVFVVLPNPLNTVSEPSISIFEIALKEITDLKRKIFEGVTSIKDVSLITNTSISTSWRVINNIQNKLDVAFIDSLERSGLINIKRHYEED